MAPRVGLVAEAAGHCHMASFATGSAEPRADTGCERLRSTWRTVDPEDGQRMVNRRRRVDGGVTMIDVMSMWCGGAAIVGRPFAAVERWLGGV